jgi:uncharacterized membrane protein YgcG
LERGHGGGEGLRPLIKGSSTKGADRVSVRAVLRGVPTATKRPPRRRTKALVGWLIYCGVAAGGTAAAFTVRDTLFPALGSAPNSEKVWDNDPAAHETTEHNSTPAPGTDAFDQAVLVETDPSVTASSVDDATVPSVSNEGPGSSIDGHGPGTQSGPNTTVDDNPNRGPGPGTTVDDHDPEATSPTSVPHDDDPVTSATTTPDPNAPGTTVADNSGKGKGGGGGGGDSGGGGGDHATAP